MAWVAPITDRTEIDISNKTSMAYLNYTDLNRIEGNTRYINDYIASYGYSSGITNIKTWVVGESLTKVEADRIRNNIQLLIDAFCKLSTLNDIVFNNTFDYTQINILERNLNELNTYIDYMAKAFLYCGDAYMGGA